MTSLREDFDDFRKWQHERAKQDDAFRVEMRSAFNGNGTEPGIFTRLDRLEQAESRRSRVAWIIFGIALTALCTALSGIAGRSGP